MGAEEPQGQDPMANVQKAITGLTEGIQNLSNVLDGGVDAASDLVKSTTALAKDEAEKASGVAQSWYAACNSGLKQADAALISTLRSGIDLARENEAATIAAGLGLAAVILPTPRRLLWRLTLGRFQSAEAAHQSAELKIASLAQRMSEQEGEVAKLVERLDLARSEYERGLAKLQGAASELRSLASRVHGTEKKSKSLMEDLRELRSKHALQLRSDVAVMATAASKRHATLNKLVANLAKDGF